MKDDVFDVYISPIPVIEPIDSLIVLEHKKMIQDLRHLLFEQNQDFKRLEDLLLQTEIKLTDAHREIQQSEVRVKKYFVSDVELVRMRIQLDDDRAKLAEREAFILRCEQRWINLYKKVKISDIEEAINEAEEEAIPRKRGRPTNAETIKRLDIAVKKKQKRL